jgi:hypothetical protein
MDGLPYLCSGFPTCRLTYVPAYQHTTASQPIWLTAVVIVIVIVHHQFKRNTYLSLLCDWIFFVYKIIFLFLSSKFAVEACDTDTYC